MKFCWHILHPRLVRGIATLCTASVVSGAYTAQADINAWTGEGGPAAGEITPLAIDPVTPRTLYVGTDGGVFKSTDGASSWHAANTGLPGNAFVNSYVVALAIDPTTLGTLYAGAIYGGVFKSMNGAHTWNAANQGLPRDAFVNAYVSALAVDPKLTRRRVGLRHRRREPRRPDHRG